MLSCPPPDAEELLEDEDCDPPPEAPACPAWPPAELAPSEGSPALGIPPPPTLGKPAEGVPLVPTPGVGMPVEAVCPAWPVWPPLLAEGEPCDPCPVCPPALPACPPDSDPAVDPPADAAPPEVEAEVLPEDEDVEPGDWLDWPPVLALVLLLERLPDPLDEEEEEGEEEGEPDDGEPPDGIPLDELLEDDDVAHPAVTSRMPAATSADARCSRTATGVTLSMAIASSGASWIPCREVPAGYQSRPCACRSSVGRAT